MDRRAPILAAAVAALLTLGACQDYNFNPVGHCLIQPGTRRVTLTDPSSADILFVVDDSGSMGGEQTALATNFTTFVNALQQANIDRANIGLEPLDFHVAITSTAMYRNQPVTGVSTCSSTCPGASGSLVCCAGGVPQPVMCKPTTDPNADVTCAAGYTCRDSTACPDAGLVGGFGCFDASCRAQRVPCTVAGRECGKLNEFYDFATCTGGYEQNLFTTNSEYPMGRFMADPAAANANDVDSPVIHFTKDLFTPTVNTTRLGELTQEFQQNVKVGTCGSGQETGLLAAKMAIDRVLGVGGLRQSASYVAGDFLHPGAKLVVVWVTDEDDCSAPAGGGDAVVYKFTPPGDPDVCEVDAGVGGEHRQTAVADFANYFTNLGRPVGAAFIAPLTTSSGGYCSDSTCQAGLCCGANGNPDACGAGVCTATGTSCGAQNEGWRYAGMANELAGRGLKYGSDLLLGSVCDSFGTSLGRVADLVKPPVSLVLPTVPAASEVAILRISDSTGRTLKTCRGPAPVAPTQPDEASAKAYVQGLTNYDWWFTAYENPTTYQQALPAAPSKNVYINHATAACEANPGETYSADYLGQLPQGGCTDAGTPSPSCATALGGDPSRWTCDGYVASVRNGTCLCN